jgi:hypothetical protein
MRTFHARAEVTIMTDRHEINTRIRHRSAGRAARSARLPRPAFPPPEEAGVKGYPYNYQGRPAGRLPQGVGAPSISGTVHPLGCDSGTFGGGLT